MTYSVKRNLARAVLLLLIGIFLIWARNVAATLAVMSLGGLVAAYGIFLFFSVRRERNIILDRRFGWSLMTFAVVCIGVGVFVMISPDFLISFFALVIGILLSLYGLYRIVVLVSLLRRVHVTLWGYLPSVLSIFAGIVVISMPNQVAALPFVLLGIGFILNAVDEFLYYLRMTGIGESMNVKEKSQKNS